MASQSQSKSAKRRLVAGMAAGAKAGGAMSVADRAYRQTSDGKMKVGGARSAMDVAIQNGKKYGIMSDKEKELLRRDFVKTQKPSVARGYGKLVGDVVQKVKRGASKFKEGYKQGLRD